MSLKEELEQAAENIYEWTLNIRRHLHQHPELSFVEHQTASYVEDKLREIGLNDFERKAETGITGLIHGSQPGPVIALRADLDALPIQEQNNVSYRSVNEGCMHACGHDVHTASLLGTLRLLHQFRTHLKGSIRYVFQPGEERLPGGATLMIKEGVLDHPIVQSMYGQHVMPLIDSGKVGFRSGLYMASADELYIRVIGKGGHAAHPHQNIDPVAVAALMITSLQQVVSRHAKPSIPSVLSIGKIEAKGATNIIPNEVYMEGTFRTFDEKWRAEAHAHIKNICESLASAHDAKVEVEIRKGYPFLKNDEALSVRSKEWAIELLGAHAVEDLDIWPAGEDFAYYSQIVPSCFYRLGTRNTEKGITHMLHTPLFNIDEPALKTGVKLMSWLAIKELEFLYER